MSFTIDLNQIDCPSLKQLWQLPDEAQFLDITPFGDFFVDLGGRYLLYSLTDGTIADVTDAVSEYGLPPVEVALGDEWYQLDAQSMLSEDGLSLQPGECFAFIKPVFQGGDYGPHNIAVESVLDYHARMCDLVTLEDKSS